MPAPDSTNDDISSKKRAGGNSQKLLLFILGKAMPGAPSIRGINQLPNPPTIMGITMKKNIISACAVTTTSYSCLLPESQLHPNKQR